MHRLKAYTGKGINVIHERCEVIEMSDKKEIYLEAVKRNMGHGKQFSTQEVVNITITLKDWKLSKQQIAEIVRIPASSLTSFVAKRMVRIAGDGMEGETKDIGLKANLSHMSGSIQNVEFATEQTAFKDSSRTQSVMIDSFISMIENGWLNVKDIETMTKIKRLHLLLGRLLKK